MRILHLATDLGPTAAARQLSHLATALPRDRFESSIRTLRPGVLGESLPSTIDLELLPLRSWFDPAGFLTWVRHVRHIRPAILHAWGVRAVTLATLLRQSGQYGGPIVATLGTIPDGRLSRFARTILRRCDAVTISTPEEQRLLDELPLEVTRKRTVPAATAAGEPHDRSALCRSLNLPDDALLILAQGSFDENCGLKTALWAFDIVRVALSQTHLLILGDGPGRDRIKDFADRVSGGHRQYRWLGIRSDAARLAASVDLIWSQHRHGGLNLFREGMIAGVPGVALATADTRSAIDSGSTGILIDRADPVALAAVTRDLLLDPVRRQTLGDAARASLRPVNSVSAMAESVGAIYDEFGTR